VNLALFATATQSTEWGGYPAYNAVDSEPGNFTHTATADLAPWWEVDLAVDARIERVSLLNRADCCGERLYNLVITAADADGAVVWTSDVLNPVAADGTPTSPGAGLTVALDTPVVARTLDALPPRS
jgi:hypothetical protein